MFQRVGLPKLTGYIATGIVVGPSVLGLLDAGMVERLRIVNGVAVYLARGWLPFVERLGELIAPALYRFALVRSGEAGKKVPLGAPMPDAAGPPLPAEP